MQPRFKLRHLTLALLAASSPVPAQAAAEEIQAGDEPVEETLRLTDTVVIGTAEEALKQAPGVSILTEEYIEKNPPVNDLSELIRRMPGVNLTGNSATGQFGNNRQIDLRGMGPENTLILIDGRPVSSRNAVRMGRSGERNTRGDSNWVPVEAVERIEVLRGPAAARYGDGAAGGVVNIITKAPSDKLTGSLSAFTSIPEHSEEGATKRLNFSLAGPMTESLSYRVYGNLNKTDADDLALNADYATSEGATPPAGREGVRNKDVNGVLRWDLSPQQVLEFQGGYSRQGNIYAGDRAVNSAGSELLTELANSGEETNILYRQSASITHRGYWDFGTSQVILAYENTRNRRLNEGLAGGPEGAITSETDLNTSELKHYWASGELNLPLSLGFEQMLTVGAEYSLETLNDPYSMTQSTATGGEVPGTDAVRTGETEADMYSLFAEDNLELTPAWLLTPGIRLDYHSDFGVNWSPSLNTAYALTDHLSLKGGIARAFKAPNLYQANPNFLYYTRGTGCPVDYPSLGTGCYVQGNDNLEAETSVNKELGISYARGGWDAGLTYFHNDYRNKITAGMVPVATTTANGRVFLWENASKAVVSGWEGFLNIPLVGVEGNVLSLNNNLTYMTRNHDEETGEPLSVIPKYTLNSMLDWQVNDALGLNLTLTHYGEQEPRSLTIQGGAATGDALNTRGGYTLYGLNANYRLSEHWKLGAGVSNLFDKRLFRQDTSGSGAGAATYNEPGRAFHASMTTLF